MEKNNKTKWIATPGLIDKIEEFEKFYKISKNLPIMICGPSGVGKSLFIDIAQKLEGRQKQPVRVNCAAFPETLIESELFGHLKGAFTGANSDKKGLVEITAGGILILEEIGELSKNIQAKLLTFIEDNYYYPVGAIKPKEAKNVKIIATTNKSREDFREDFWYRFFPFFIPPLHKRRGDILYYLAHIFPDITETLMPWEILTLLCYNWPGNVREIERVGRLILLGRANEKKPQKDEKYPWMKHPIFAHVGSRNDFTALDGTKSMLLSRDLKSFGVDTTFLEEVLRKFKIGLSPIGIESAQPAFVNLEKLTGKFNKRIKKEFGISNLFEVEDFDLARRGLGVYCALFKQSPLENKNLFDVEDEDLKFLLRFDIFLDKPSNKHYKLEKEIFEFLLKIKLPKEIKRLPDHYTKEHYKFMSFLEKEYSKNNDSDDIASLSWKEMTSLYLKKLLIRYGTQVEAAKRAGVPLGTFKARLKKATLRPIDDI